MGRIGLGCSVEGNGRKAAVKGIVKEEVQHQGESGTRRVKQE